jgi:hypothetical protein
MNLPPEVRQTVKTLFARLLRIHCTACCFDCNIAVVDERGFFLTWQAMRSQLAAMPNELYLIRLIHHQTRRPFPGERLWAATQLVRVATIGFLRIRNCEGDVYIQPYAGEQNAGYVLVDLDCADPMVVEVMRANGHDPCVVLQTCPGSLQAWSRLSTAPLEPEVATAAGKHLARLYAGDLASTDWHHLGRLAGFKSKAGTMQSDGYAPWVKLIHAGVGLAPGAEAMLHSLRPCAYPHRTSLDGQRGWPNQRGRGHDDLPELCEAKAYYREYPNGE